MIPNEKEFSLKVGKLGISNDHHIIAYDTLGIFSSAESIGCLNSTVIEEFLF